MVNWSTDHGQVVVRPRLQTVDPSIYYYEERRTGPIPPFYRVPRTRVLYLKENPNPDSTISVRSVTSEGFDVIITPTEPWSRVLRPSGPCRTKGSTDSLLTLLFDEGHTTYGVCQKKSGWGSTVSVPLTPNYSFSDTTET